MSTWKRVVPEQSRKGDLIEHGSLECQERIQYRWVNLNPKIDWVCVGTTKYYKQKQQVSNDYGQTCGDVIPYQYQRGASYQTKSTDCGYVPEPLYRKTNMDISTDYECGYVPPTGTKFYAKYSDENVYSKACDGNTTLTTGDTRPTGYEHSAMTEATIGDCVTSIGDYAFFWCESLASITIPNSVTSIGYDAFYDCRSLTSVTIPDSVTSIGNYAFYYCSSLQYIIINATVPPTLGIMVFDYTGNCPIYVPEDSLSEYRTATNWSNYASRIKPMIIT